MIISEFLGLEDIYLSTIIYYLNYKILASAKSAIMLMTFFFFHWNFSDQSSCRRGGLRLGNW